MKIDRVRVHGKRRVYVSWLIRDDDRLAWKSELWDRLDAQTATRWKSFDDSWQTDPQASGTMVDEAAKSLFEPGEGKTPVTDVVAVLTNLYARENFGNPERAKGELARFVDHIRKHDTRDAVRVFLAPVDEPDWQTAEVRELPLRDAGRTLPWLVKLRETMFTWPVTNRERCAREVAEAVEAITGEPQETTQ